MGSIITVFQHRTKRQLELISSSVFLQSFFFLSFFFALFLVLVSSSSQKNFIHTPRFIRFIKAFPMGPHNHFYSFFFLYSFPFFHILSLITVFPLFCLLQRVSESQGFFVLRKKWSHIFFINLAVLYVDDLFCHPSIPPAWIVKKF